MTKQAETIRCFFCHQRGHYADSCPQKAQSKNGNKNNNSKPTFQVNAIEEYEDKPNYAIERDSNAQEFDDEEDYISDYDNNSRGQQNHQSGMPKLDTHIPTFHTLLKMNGQVNGKDALILHDDGSTHDFRPEHFARSLRLQLVPSHYKVKAAFKNHKYNCTQKLHGVNLSIAPY